MVDVDEQEEQGNSQGNFEEPTLIVPVERSPLIVPVELAPVGASFRFFVRDGKAYHGFSGERFCLFLDEAGPLRSRSGSRLVVSAVVSLFDDWDDRVFRPAARIGALGKKRRLYGIDGFLAGLPGQGVIGFADIPPWLGMDGVTDSTRDIPRMSRWDNIWSWVFLQVVTYCLGRLCAVVEDEIFIEVYHDPKTLTRHHWRAIERTLDEKVARTARGALFRFNPVGFSAHREVRKRRDSGKPPTKHQIGTNIAHHLCSRAEEAIASSNLCAIETVDFTESVLEIAERFAEDIPTAP